MPQCSLAQDDANTCFMGENMTLSAPDFADYDFFHT